MKKVMADKKEVKDYDKILTRSFEVMKNSV